MENQVASTMESGEMMFFQFQSSVLHGNSYVQRAKDTMHQTISIGIGSSLTATGLYPMSVPFTGFPLNDAIQPKNAVNASLGILR